MVPFAMHDAKTLQLTNSELDIPDRYRTGTTYLYQGTFKVFFVFMHDWIFSHDQGVRLFCTEYGVQVRTFFAFAFTLLSTLDDNNRLCFMNNMSLFSIFLSATTNSLLTAFAVKVEAQQQTINKEALLVLIPDEEISERQKELAVDFLGENYQYGQRPFLLS